MRHGQFRSGSKANQATRNLQAALAPPPKRPRAAKDPAPTIQRIMGLVAGATSLVFIGLLAFPLLREWTFNPCAALRSQAQRQGYVAVQAPPPTTLQVADWMSCTHGYWRPR